MSAPSTHRFEWQGLSLTVVFDPNWSPAMSGAYGCAMAHLGIQTNDRRPLPITETGYRSAFVPASEIEQGGGVESFVLDWLDAFADDPEWQDRQTAARQLTLF